MQLTYRGISYKQATPQEQLPTAKAHRLQFLGQPYQASASSPLIQRQEPQQQLFLKFLGHSYSLCC